MPVRINYVYYPFAASPREYPKLFVERPSLIVSGSSDLKEKLLHVLRSITENKEIPVGIFNDPEESILVYNALLDVARSFGDRRLMNRIALAYSKTASKNLENEKDEVLVAVVNKLGLHAKLERVSPPCLPVIVRQKRRSKVEFAPYAFLLPIAEYLRVVSRRLLHDSAYALINNIVQGGFVFLDRRTFKRVVEEYIFQVIVQQLDQLSPPSTEEYNKLLEEVKFLIAEMYTSTSEEQTTLATGGKEGPNIGIAEGILEELFPPCIKRIIDILNSGGNPSHVERFNLAAFLGNIGLDVDDILEYFEKTADFNERIARYQIEHILGLRGGKKKYKPYNCVNMRTSGICPLSEPCPGGKNPLAVYRHNLRQARKATRSKEAGEKAAGGI